jgi:hypothetical protein
MWYFILCQERDTTIRVVPVAAAQRSWNTISSKSMHVHSWAISGFEAIILRRFTYLPFSCMKQIHKNVTNLRHRKKNIFKTESAPQGCQMVCFQTKNPNFENFWRENVDAFYVHLEYFTDIWYIL